MRNNGGKKDRQAFSAGSALDCVSLREVCTLEQRASLCRYPNMTLLDAYRPLGINISSFKKIIPQKLPTEKKRNF